MHVGAGLEVVKALVCAKAVMFLPVTQTQIFRSEKSDLLNKAYTDLNKAAFYAW